jgi:hypothetical protein
MQSVLQWRKRGLAQQMELYFKNPQEMSGDINYFYIYIVGFRGLFFPSPGCEHAGLRAEPRSIFRDRSIRQLPAANTR